MSWNLAPAEQILRVILLVGVVEEFDSNASRPLVVVVPVTMNTVGIRSTLDSQVSTPLF